MVEARAGGELVAGNIALGRYTKESPKNYFDILLGLIV
jgi:hypothetical protein